MERYSVPLRSHKLLHLLNVPNFSTLSKRAFSKFRKPYFAEIEITSSPSRRVPPSSLVRGCTPTQSQQGGGYLWPRLDGLPPSSPNQMDTPIQSQQGRYTKSWVGYPLSDWMGVPHCPEGWGVSDIRTNGIPLGKDG